ncbi:MAG: Gfo/Idh/MocA family oxidoreductase [Acidobacteriota bacterium]|nr:Gfo/Idh/MocA family oxidoreductase [Acidobacteriota bacterium]
MTRRIRAGVVGVGYLGRHHARIWSGLPGVRLAGVVDLDTERAAEVAGKYDASRFASIDELAREIDVASVATPTATHEDCAAPLLERGVAVLVEKPIAPDMKSGTRMRDLAARSGAPLMVGHTERFHPAVTGLLERVSRPRFVEIHRLAPFKPRSLDVDVLLDLMIHDLDLCRLIFDRRPVTRFDASGTPALTDHIDIASVRVRFEGGAAANLTASRISGEPVRRVRVFEPGAFVACDTAANTLSVYRLVRQADGPRVTTEQVDVPREEPLAREIAAFRDAVTGGTEVPCTAEDGLAALDLALRIGEAIEADLEQNP